MSRPILLWASAALALCLGAESVPAAGKIYGTVTTFRGDRHTGTIRWDGGEVFWSDLFEAYRSREVEDDDRDFEIRLFGWSLARFGDDKQAHAKLSVAFGHIRSIERTRDGQALITLKSDHRVRAPSGADIGDSLEGIVVETGEGPVELGWDDLERVDFAKAPTENTAAAGPRRLYGTVDTEQGPFAGYVVWDRDESTLDEMLDGDEGDVDRSIAFASIRRIEKVDNDGSRVLLDDDSTVVLTGSNDVNERNRGIEVVVDGLGRVRVGWHAFRAVTFSEPPSPPTYDEFDGGRTLAGTVRHRDGREIEGTIVWDRDERYTWEMLDGEAGDLTYEVTFGAIRQIRPGDDEAVVVLVNDAELRLDGTNDVDDGNRGILVTDASGQTHEFDWREVASVTFR